MRVYKYEVDFPGFITVRLPPFVFLADTACHSQSDFGNAVHQELSDRRHADSEAHDMLLRPLRPGPGQSDTGTPFSCRVPLVRCV